MDVRSVLLGCWCMLSIQFIDSQRAGVFNAARGKRTWQSSTYGEHSSERAVDGCAETDLDSDCCTHTDNTPDTWWSVDLGQNYSLVDVTLTNGEDCCGNRLLLFKIYGSFVSGEPSASDKTQCAEQDRDPVEGSASFQCDITARYIIIEKNIPSHWGDAYFALTLCEVEVLAECSAGKYGVGCTEDCSPYCRNGAVCDKETGNCPDELCSVGYDGPKCEQSCDTGYFGENCVGQCSPHCQETCDKFSTIGSCSGRCVAGYTGDICAQECQPGFYGDGCTAECYCSHDNCNFISGCMGGCMDGWEGDACLKRVVDPNDASGNALIYGSIAGLIVVVAIIAVIIVIIFYKRKKQRRRHPSKPKLDNEEELDCFSAPGSSRQEMNQNGIVGNQTTVLDTNGNAGFTPDVEAGYESQISDDDDVTDLSNVYMNVDANNSDSKTRIRKENLSEYIDRQKREAYPFKQEYECIPKQTSLWNEAARPELKSKNRYRNILPYDYNRVVLSKVKGDKFSDYINASYIKHNNGDTAYIAALGVTKATMVDFWRMIWEHNVSTIIMVTNLYEEGKIKCDQYWPSDKQAQIGHFTLALNLEERPPSYVLRKMTVSKDGKSKKLCHYHYTDWPDKGAPTNLRTLLTLRKVIQRERTIRNIPIVVHCSAGVGRTGTIIALDILLDQLEKDKAVDIRQCVVKLRKQRTNMVQTLAQYRFLYEALEEIISIGDTTLSCQNLKSLVKKDGAILYEQQFKFLESCKPKFGDVELDFGRVDHREKNRDVNVVPAYHKRAKIPSHPGIYINAVHVKGYRPDFDYCVTQIPLHNTVLDFWNLVTELKSSVVVCFQGDETDVSWLPKVESVLECRTLNVKLDSWTAFEHWIEYDITVYQQGAVLDTEYANVGNTQVQNRTKVLAVKGSWTSLENKKCIALFGHIYHKMDGVRKASRKKQLTTVMCLNGATESGLFVAGSYLMDMSEIEGEIDVFHTVKLIRATRPQFVNTLDQYKLLHKLPAATIVDNGPSGPDYYNVRDVHSGVSQL